MPENEVDAIDSTEGAGAMADEPVRIVPYDPSWPERFEQERAVLAAAIGDLVVGGIHHVGSTSVPGLGAKPIIDILVGVRGLEESRSCFDRLGRLEYLYAPYRSGEMHWFCKPDPSRRTHHLHLVPADSPRFRDDPPAPRRGSTRFEPLTRAVRVQRGRLGRVHEVDQHLQEPLGLVELRKVAGALEDLQAAAGELLVGCVSVGHRDDRVALAPDQQERDVLGKVEPV